MIAPLSSGRCRVIPPVMRGRSRRARGPAPGFLDQRCCEREQEALCFAGARAAGNDNICSIASDSLDRLILVKMEIARRGKESLSDEGREFGDFASSPSPTQKGSCSGAECLIAADVRRGRLEQWRAIGPSVAVEHCPALIDQRLVPKIERTIEVAQISFAQLAEELYWVCHEDLLPEPLAQQGRYRPGNGWLDISIRERPVLYRREGARTEHKRPFNKRRRAAGRAYLKCSLRTSVANRRVALLENSILAGCRFNGKCSFPFDQNMKGLVVRAESEKACRSGPSLIYGAWHPSQACL